MGIASKLAWGQLISSSFWAAFLYLDSSEDDEVKANVSSPSPLILKLGLMISGCRGSRLFKSNSFGAFVLAELEHRVIFRVSLVVSEKLTFFDFAAA